MKRTILLINQLLVIQIRRQKGLGGKFGRISPNNYPLLTFILILFLGASCDQQAAAPSATPSLTTLAQA
ncbi:MAG: hypothetical protein ACPG8W_23140, partial [Candidatus Promineifilaceae bacterium]